MDFHFSPRFSAICRSADLLPLLVTVVCAAPINAATYGLVHTSTPVLNTPDFKAVFGGANNQKLKTDNCGQIRELEYIAPQGTVFAVHKKVNSYSDGIYQVDTADYQAPPNVRLYVNGRYLELLSAEPPPRKLSLPTQEEIVSALRGAVGKPYVWGGNIPDGVPWLIAGSVKDRVDQPILAGLDCSGLLYHATNGWTPRNTSQLITYGQEVAIAGKRPAEIAAMLQPLDLIVWNGHVIIVLDQHVVIESRLECGKLGNGGVVTTGLQQRLSEIMKTRRPHNIWPVEKKRQDIFVVRRWYPS